MGLTVLRLGHRLPRDERISTHVALVARAFGADSIVYSGQRDHGLEESVRRICLRWGVGRGPVPFSITYEKDAIASIAKAKERGSLIVHLTMYGLPADGAASRIREAEDALIIVGSEAVPGEVFDLADMNVSVTNQPHSEVAALAVLLDRVHQGKELSKDDFCGKIAIIPDPRGKKTIEKKG
jgi:tRNA (cytidine56-2'-O)-methyltransferase